MRGLDWNYRQQVRLFEESTVVAFRTLGLEERVQGTLEDKKVLYLVQPLLSRLIMASLPVAPVPLRTGTRTAVHVLFL